MQISLLVNGERVDAAVAPNTHLADFLRERCNLTGTHLGCEHGVCGACTVHLDGVPVRSCITYAVACDGAAVRTIEGFPDDPVMTRLRDAFKLEHALQCGFCTPGMLMFAHDLVQRLPGADETRIRAELAGNICRCTGYMGIVAAIKRVASAEMDRTGGKPVASAVTPTTAPVPLFMPETTGAAAPRQASVISAQHDEFGCKEGWSRIVESFTIERPPEEIWPLLGDIPRMASCMPGAILEESDGRTLRGRFKVRLGPIQASFAGTAILKRDDARMIGRMDGGGDEKGSSRAEGTIVYALEPRADGRATFISATMDYRVQGALAQFGRSGIARDIVSRTVTQFLRNVAALTEGAAPPAGQAGELDARHLFGMMLWSHLKGWFAALVGHRGR
jgi:aerobic carbon-monoxide dehydrogenase small subunit